MRLSAEQCKQLIQAAGGLQAFAKKLDPNKAWASNRILWWTKRGIPADIQLDYQDRLQALQAELLP